MISDSIAAIEPEIWDSLLQPGDLLASHRFIKVCEESQIFAGCARHVTIFQDDTLIGGASFFLLHVHLDLLSKGLARFVITSLRRLFPDFLAVPVVICGLPVSFGSSCIRVKDQTDTADVMSIIVRALDEFAEENNAGLICIKELDEDEHSKYGPLLKQSGFIPAESLPGCRLDIKWTSYEEYLASMRAAYRRNILIDRTAAVRNGLTIERGGKLMADKNMLYQLYLNVIDRAQFKMEILPRRFFAILENELRDDLQSLSVTHGGNVVANAILLGRSPVCYFLLAGLDYPALKAGHAYQNLVSSVIGAAIGAGADRLELGQTSYELKCRLGGHLTPRYIWLKHRQRYKHKALGISVPYLFPATEKPVRRVFHARMTDQNHQHAV